MAKKDNNTKQAPCNNCSKATCEKEDKPAQKNIERLLLVGNSPNLVDGQNRRSKWSEALNRLEEAAKPYLDESSRSLSFPERMENINNCVKQGHKDVKEAIKKWYKDLCEILPSPVHKMLTPLIQNYFRYVLTTNYDFAIEKAIHPCFNPKKEKEGSKSYSENNIILKPQNGVPQVSHIHGIASNSNRIVMSSSEYEDALGSLPNRTDDETSWLHFFIHSELHICGLELQDNEKLIWHAIKKRKEWLDGREYLKNKRPYAFAYLFYTGETDKSMKEEFGEVLKSYAIIPVLIPVRNENYFAAWKQLAGEMLSRLAKTNPQENNKQLSEDVLRLLERGGGIGASRKARILSTASAPCYKDPYLCQLSVSCAKRKDISKTPGKWLIYCRVFEKRYFYKLNWESIQNSYPESEEPWNFFLDYERGILYRVAENGVSLEKVTKAQRCINVDEFCKEVGSNIEK